jgi:cytochrome bd ubiquinol oxidase subunit I
VDKLDLARMQFATTSIYHFLFVPTTIGLGFLVALLQTSWYHTGEPAYLRLTRFFGTLLVINIAVGVVTGLVQEFQFGMDWSVYSRLVGGVFGAPLALEGLGAFFLESTFLGLWLFGWNRLSPRLHLACIWAVAIGSALSAFFIICANSWMQHPVGYSIDPTTHRAELTSITAVLTSNFALWAYAHVLLASLLTGASVMLAVSCWQLRKGTQVELFTRSARLSLLILLPVSIAQIVVGSELGVVVEREQPMKIAAAEALWNTQQPADFSVFQIGGFTESDQTPAFSIEIPGLLSVLATNHRGTAVPGINQLQAQDEQRYGPGNYIPNVAVAYWSIRVMAGLATVVVLLAAWGVWLLHRGRIAASRRFQLAGVLAVVMPFIMNTAGWVLTEMGRQPWIVYGVQHTEDAVSPSLSAATIAISLGTFIVLYGLLAVLDAVLMVHYAKREAEPAPEVSEDGRTLGAMSY